MENQDPAPEKPSRRVKQDPAPTPPVEPAPPPPKRVLVVKDTDVKCGGKRWTRGSVVDDPAVADQLLARGLATLED